MFCFKQPKLSEPAMSVIAFLDKNVLPASEGAIKRAVGGGADYVSSILRDLKERGLIVELAVSHGLWKLSHTGHREAWVREREGIEE